MSTLSVNDVNSLNANNLSESFQTLEGTFNSQGSIKVNGKDYKVSLSYGKDGTLQADVKRQYNSSGIRGFFHDLLARSRTATANAISDRLNTLFRSKEMRIITSNIEKFNEILAENKDKKEIIVANYGFSAPRRIVANANLVKRFNDKLAASGQVIKFSKIDDYNTISGIRVENMNIARYRNLMDDIRNKKLVCSYDAECLKKDHSEADIKSWQEFLARPENAAKIDIPAKLHRYLHINDQPAAGSPHKTTGWEGDFRRNPQEALRHFVMKNLAYKTADTSPERIDFYCARLREYTEIYSDPDETSRNARMKEFMKYDSWITQEELEERAREYVDEEVTLEEAVSFIKSSYLSDVNQLPRFIEFNNIISNATFRQTSKLGLDFFHEMKHPVMLQYADHQGIDLKSKNGAVFQEDYWKRSELVPGTNGSPITHSEIRHAKKIQVAEQDNFSIHLSRGVMPPQD